MNRVAAKRHRIPADAGLRALTRSHVSEGAAHLDLGQTKEEGSGNVYMISVLAE